MKILKLSIFLSVFLVPSFAFAWGPLTHVYLGSEILSLGPLLPAGIYALIRKYRHDYLYGNLMADIIIGKKYLPEDKNPHSWDMAMNLFDAAETQQQKAFVFGYLSHLAADTIAHGKFTNSRRNIEHTLFEMRADCIIDKRYWFQAISIDRRVQRRNDIFLEKSLESALFSFKTNKRIFKSVVLLSGFNKERLGNFIQKNIVYPEDLAKHNIRQLHFESMERIVDILSNGKDAGVLKESPMVS